MKGLKNGVQEHTALIRLQVKTLPTPSEMPTIREGLKDDVVDGECVEDRDAETAWHLRMPSLGLPTGGRRQEGEPVYPVLAGGLPEKGLA